MAKSKATEGLNIVGVTTQPPSKFVLVPAFQGRTTPVGEDDLIALADSMRTEGQQQPIQVRSIKGTDTFEIIFGNTRKRAADLIVAGYKDGNGKDVKPNPDFKLRAEIVDIDDKDAFRRNVVENAFRNACTAMDNAKNQEKLRTEHEMSDAAIARLYGYDQANVTRLKKLLTLPEDIQEQIHRGYCSARAGSMLADAKDVVTAGAFDTVWQKCKEGAGEDGDKIGEAQMAAAIKEWRTEQKQAAAVTPDGQAPAGSPVTPDGSQPPAGDGTVPMPVETPTIGLTYKQFKDTFRDAVASPRVPDGCKGLCQMILDFAEGKVEDKDFTQFLLATTGEELLPEPEVIPGQEGSAASGEQPAEQPAGEPVPSAVPQQEATPPANGSTGKRKPVARK